MIQELSEREQLRDEEEISRTVDLPEYKNPFEMKVFKILITKKMLSRNSPEETEKYGKIISDFIKNPEHADIRDLIIQKRIEDAAEIMVAELEKEKEDLLMAA